MALDALGEGTGQEIIARAYPLLDKVLSEADGDRIYDGYETLPPDRCAAIDKAVDAERNRLGSDQTQTRAPLTELGRDVKNQTDAPTVLLDRLVPRVAARKLRHFRGHGKPS